LFEYIHNQFKLIAVLRQIQNPVEQAQVVHTSKAAWAQQVVSQAMQARFSLKGCNIVAYQLLQNLSLNFLLISYRQLMLQMMPWPKAPHQGQLQKCPGMLVCFLTKQGKPRV
jgi:hypothetical protein